jgi:hypothetical protein
MFDLVKKLCKKCERRAAFNFQDYDFPLFCSIHKEEGMIDLKNKSQRCEKCSKYATYNLEGQKKARFCLEHKEDNMINVKNKRCDKCDSIANFGFCAQLPVKCAKHKEDKMYFKPKRVCIGNDEEDCKELATFGITEPKHCEDHSTDKEVCLLGKKCNGCFREDLILNRNGLCILFCEPDEIYKKIERDKIKEKIVLNYLDQNINTKNIIKIIDDKTLNHFCNKYRPDRVYDCGTHYVIVEVDENQHKRYHSICSKGEKAELIRMHEIRNAAGIHCIFLRFNPDDFKVNNEKKKINMAQRLKILKKWIEYCFNKIPNKDLVPVEVKYLFYDNYEEDNLNFFIIDDILVYRTTI